MGNKIKFSHAYQKLASNSGEPIRRAKLLLVLPVPMETISRAKDFLDYDTDNGKYKLGFATFYVLLVFQKPSGDLFTTVRPQWNQFGNKQKFYEPLIGQHFDIVITG